jgi:hypothetical protein
MKRADFIYETYLLSITLLAVAGLLLNGEDGIIALFLWLAMLGICQLGHSIVMGVSYPFNKRLKRLLVAYWTIVPFAFIPVAGILFIVPFLSIYMWWISWSQWRETERTNN